MITFDPPLLSGKLIKRYKRFLADIELDSGEFITAHCPNSGSMMGLKEPGFPVLVQDAQNPNRKLKYTFKMVQADGAWVGIDTGIPNKLVYESIEQGLVPELAGYTTMKREVKYGKNSRIDIFMQSDDKPDCYVEVKNVTLKDGPSALFPDAVTTRGQKHLQELSDVVSQSKRAVMFYLIQRDDCEHFDIASDIDPEYKIAFDAAIKAGVEVICYDCKITETNISLNQKVTMKK